MRRAVAVAESLMFFLMAVGCQAQASRGRCVIRDADSVVHIKGKHLNSLEIVRRDSDPKALLLVTGGDDAATQKRQAAIQVDLNTGEQVEDWVPYELSPLGYKRFASGPPLSPLHPLLASKTLHFEYMGRRTSIPLPNRNADGDWSLVRQDHFTGTRRIAYDSHALVDQDFTNYTWLVGIEEHVQIEPDGDRIVCLCTDGRGSWLGVFSKTKLDAARTAQRNTNASRSPR
jgi:hypothetical protein